MHHFEMAYVNGMCFMYIKEGRGEKCLRQCKVGGGVFVEEGCVWHTIYQVVQPHTRQHARGVRLSWFTAC